MLTLYIWLVRYLYIMRYLDIAYLGSASFTQSARVWVWFLQIMNISNSLTEHLKLVCTISQIFGERYLGDCKLCQTVFMFSPKLITRWS